ncbi:MAG: hypothetical protein LUD22_00385, partial [Coprobacillus sp.]|nr:hypothetical protein [Coprobacillus sp.]
FMVIQKSIYDYAEGGEDTATTSLSEYYTTAVPGDDDYPTYTDASGNKVNKDTYVSFISSTDQSVSKGRADSVKSLINSFDSTYDYRLYEEFVEEGMITFSESVAGTDIGEQIDKLIANKRTYNKWNAEKELNDEWRTYLELIELQEQERAKKDRLLGETCAIGFKTANTDGGEEWQKGGACYVE